MVTLRYSAFLALALTGCGSFQPRLEPQSEQQEIGSILKSIDERMVLAVDAQRELAMMADAKDEREDLSRKRLFSDVISMDFYGDIEDILGQIARRYDYEFLKYGPRPQEAVLVNVFVTKKPAIEILKHVGYQTKMVDVRVTKKTIELHYLQSPGR